VVVAPMAFAAKRHGGTLAWLLVGGAIAPPIAFMVVPQVNRFSDVWLHEGIRIATPEVRVWGRKIVPSQTIFEIDPLIQPPMGNHVAFEALAIEAPYFYDSSPPNSFDLVLIDQATNSEVGVAVPAPCPATVVSTAWHGGYGNTVDLQCEDGTGVFIAHFEEVWVSAGQMLKKGETFAVQGDTGRSFGKHLHVEIDLNGDDQPEPYDQSEPIMRRFMALWETGLAAPTPVASAGSTLSDEVLMKAIGKAEGTVDSHLNPDADYWGHTDPGNGARNQGFFSFQHGASSPRRRTKSSCSGCVRRSGRFRPRPKASLVSRSVRQRCSRRSICGIRHRWQGRILSGCCRRPTRHRSRSLRHGPRALLNRPRGR